MAITILAAELEVGARQSTVYWLLERYVIPNATYSAQLWGLLAGSDVWAEADDALDRLCAALAPADVRQAGLAEPLRRELALP